MGKSDVDGDAAPLFFFQAVGIGAGQGAYQGALPVVNMPGRTDNDGFHELECNAGRTGVPKVGAQGQRWFSLSLSSPDVLSGRTTLLNTVRCARGVRGFRQGGGQGSSTETI